MSRPKFDVDDIFELVRRKMTSRILIKLNVTRKSPPTVCGLNNKKLFYYLRRKEARSMFVMAKTSKEQFLKFFPEIWYLKMLFLLSGPGVGIIQDLGFYWLSLVTRISVSG